MRFGVSLQKQLLGLPWPREILDWPDCAEVRDPTSGSVLWRGLRVRIGIAWGKPSYRKPLNTGWPPFINSFASSPEPGGSGNGQAVVPCHAEQLETSTKTAHSGQACILLYPKIDLLQAWPLEMSPRLLLGSALCAISQALSLTCMKGNQTARAECTIVSLNLCPLECAVCHSRFVHTWVPGFRYFTLGVTHDAPCHLSKFPHVICIS